MAILEPMVGGDSGSEAIKKLDRNIKKINIEVGESGGTDVSSSSVNGNIKVDGEELQVYRISNDLVDNLTSTNAAKALAAPQGKILAEQISILTEEQGDLENLQTVNKTSLVTAINEVKNTGGLSIIENRNSDPINPLIGQIWLVNFPIVDTFENGVIGSLPPGWAIDTTGGITTALFNGSKVMKRSGSTGALKVIRWENQGVFSDCEISYEFQLMVDGLCDPSGGLRINVNGDLYALLVNGALVRLYKNVGGVGSVIASITQAQALNTWYVARFKITGNVLQGKVWVKGASEPAWQITATDNAIATGYVGVRSTQTFDWVIDNFAIVSGS